MKINDLDSTAQHILGLLTPKPQTANEVAKIAGLSYAKVACQLGYLASNHFCVCHRGKSTNTPNQYLRG